MRRTGKFYFNNEKKVLNSLGLTPSPGSGSGWIIKEDGENETIMVQLKSTDSNSYKLNMLDIKKLEYHSTVSHKHPLFLIQFLQQDRIYAVVDINNLSEVAKGIALGYKPKEELQIQEQELVEKKVVKTNKKEREEFFKERQGGNGKRKRF